MPSFCFIFADSLEQKAEKKMSSQPTFNFAGCTVQGDLNTGTQKKSNITGSKYFATGDNATFTIYEKGGYLGLSLSSSVI